MAQRIYEIAVTGPAGSGKDETIDAMVETPQLPGWRVLRMPEIATPVISGGLKDIMQFAQSHPKLFLEIQKAIFELQIVWREKLRTIAQHIPEPNCLILHNRGFMDQLIYVTQQQFRQMRLEAGKTLYDTRDSYDAVLFLRSAAWVDKYSTDNNKVRRETAEESLAQEGPLLKAWIGHPHLHIVPSYPEVSEKLRRFRDTVAHTLSETEIERKFKVRPDPAVLASEYFADSAVTDIGQRYLKNDAFGNCPRIRKEWQDDSVSCSRTHKERTDPGSALKRKEEEYRITPDAYKELCSFEKDDSVTIRKKRRYFVHGNQYFSLDVFQNPQVSFWLLEAELVHEHDPLILPTFIQIEEEVTNNSNYTNREIARVKTPAVAQLKTPIEGRKDI